MEELIHDNRRCGVKSYLITESNAQRMKTLILGYSHHLNYYYYHHHHYQISGKFKHDFNKIQCSNEASPGIVSMSFCMNKGNVVRGK